MQPDRENRFGSGHLCDIGRIDKDAGTVADEGGFAGFVLKGLVAGFAGVAPMTLAEKVEQANNWPTKLPRAGPHVAAINRPPSSGRVGSELGHAARDYSVRDVIATVEAVSDRKVPVKLGERRAGDPATLVASSERIKAEAGWQPRYAELEDIVRTAYLWRKNHPGGYGDRSAPTAGIAE